MNRRHFLKAAAAVPVAAAIPFAPAAPNSEVWMGFDLAQNEGGYAVAVLVDRCGKVLRSITADEFYVKKWTAPSSS